MRLRFALVVVLFALETGCRGPVAIPATSAPPTPVVQPPLPPCAVGEPSPTARAMTLADVKQGIDALAGVRVRVRGRVHLELEMKAIIAPNLRDSMPLSRDHLRFVDAASIEACRSQMLDVEGHVEHRGGGARGRAPAFVAESLREAPR